MINARSVKLPTVTLIAILLLAFGVRVYDLNYNSPFLDEALYLVLGDQVLKGHWQESNPFSWVGGMPLLYPPLAALFGKFGGVLGARFLNVLLGTLSVYLLYDFSRNLRLTDSKDSNIVVGLLAAAGLSILAIPVYLSRLAIYDALSFTLFLTGLVFVQWGMNMRQSAPGRRENSYIAAAIFFFASFLAKYVTLTFFPLVAVWVLLMSRRARDNSFWPAIVYFVVPLAVASASYIAWNFQALQHFSLDQIGDPQRNYALILTQFMTYAGVPFALALMGSAVLIFKRRAWLASGLLIAALSVPGVHLIQNSAAAMHQHTFLSLVFLLPLAAYGIWSVTKVHRLASAAAGLLVASFLMYQSALQLKTLQSAWPNATEVMQYVQSATSNHEKLLSSEDDVTKLMVKNLQMNNVIGIYNFQYKGSQDADAYRWALADGYFDVVLMNEHVEGDVGKAVNESLTNHYAATFNQHPYIVYTRQ